jgi:hypothetical protein
LIAAALVISLSLTHPCRADEDDDASNPHLMVLKDGTPDTDKCSFCHEDDLTLSRSKEETCTSCHTVATHAGSSEHVNAPVEAVKRLVPATKPGGVDFPLTDSGGMYCGTCHVVHDPEGVVTGEKWLPAGCAESQTPFARAVRAQVEKSRESITDAQAAHFVAEGSRALRLPACDGTLCRSCHQDLP